MKRLQRDSFMHAESIRHLAIIRPSCAEIVEEFAASAATLHDQADDLARAVAVFKLSAAY